MTMVEKLEWAMQAEADKWQHDSLDKRFVYSHRHALARAALEAMREPTEAMRNAWLRIETPTSIMRGPVNMAGLEPGFDIAPFWRAMIDAALAEKP